MANNYTTSSSRTTENDPLSSSPVWIVPENSTSTSDKSILLSNNNTKLPTYNSFSAPSAPEIDDEPPNYFDISIVPSGAVLYNNEIIPYAEGSKAEIERDMKGVLLYDSLIDKNPDQLWLYFMTYLNEKPQLKVNICGYYTEVKLLRIHLYWMSQDEFHPFGNLIKFRTVSSSRKNPQKYNMGIQWSSSFSLHASIAPQLVLCDHFQSFSSDTFVIS